MATTITVPEKWAFNESENNKGKITDAIGLDEARFDEMQAYAKDVAFRAVMTDKKINTTTKAWEVLLNEAKPKNMIEAFVLGVFYENVEKQVKNIAKKMAEAAGL
jgi:hypothetical protein